MIPEGNSKSLGEEDEEARDVRRPPARRRSADELAVGVPVEPLAQVFLPLHARCRGGSGRARIATVMRRRPSALLPSARGDKQSGKRAGDDTSYESHHSTFPPAYLTRHVTCVDTYIDMNTCTHIAQVNLHHKRQTTKTHYVSLGQHINGFADRWA